MAGSDEEPRCEGKQWQYSQADIPGLSSLRSYLGCLHPQSPAGLPVDLSDLTPLSSFQTLIRLKPLTPACLSQPLHCTHLSRHMVPPEANNPEVRRLATGVQRNLGSS